jgi:hypothetical protein
MNDRLAHLRVRIEDDGSALVVDEAGGKGASILAAPDLVQDPAAQARLQDVRVDRDARSTARNGYRTVAQWSVPVWLRQKVQTVLRGHDEGAG